MVQMQLLTDLVIYFCIYLFIFHAGLTFYLNCGPGGSGSWRSDGSGPEGHGEVLPSCLV